MKKLTLPQLKKKCWTVFSEWVRRKNADSNGTVECYTCRGKYFWREVDAGHFVPGRTGSVLLHPDIVKPQCKRCNIFLRGNYHAYTLRMIDDYGREQVDQWLTLKNKVHKWTRAELEDILEHYTAQLKVLRLLDQL